MPLDLNLLVLRCRDVELTRRFYAKLGLVFAEEQHGTGPRHYAWEKDRFVLELYQATAGQPPDNVRLGFSTPSLADVSGAIRHDPEVTMLKPPHTTVDRLALLLQDPDGRKVEVSQQLHH
jgi:catechol 2,3-dioxygenase-like lactoylglutathione lyase family enzyme